MCAVDLPLQVGASYLSEIRNEPPSRASNTCTWLVMPVGTIHVATARIEKRFAFLPTRGRSHHQRSDLKGSFRFQTQLEGPGATLSGSNAVTSGIVIARFGSQASSSRTGATGKVQFSVAPAVPSGLLQPVLSISCQ